MYSLFGRHFFLLIYANNFEIELICIYVMFHMGGGTGTLAGSHIRLAIYPTLTIHYRSVVICALLNIRFKGRR